MGLEVEVSSPETGRSRRQSPIEIELKQVLADRSGSPGDDDFRNASFDIFDDSESSTFRPKLGLMGAPQCRFTTSVIALIAITTGMTLVAGGVCIIVFFVELEPTILPLGVTLTSLGGIMLLAGSAMWISEFLCNDCLGRAYVKMKEAPLKNALERRSRMASRTTNRVDSRLSSLSKVSYRTTSSKATVSTKY